MVESTQKGNHQLSEDFDSDLDMISESDDEEDDAEAKKYVRYE